MKLKKCEKCKIYTLNDSCSKCEEKASDAHYKFVNVRDAPKSDIRIVRKN